MTGKMLHYPMICTALALVVAFSIPYIMPNASAHSPASVELSYDLDTGTLTVQITHSVATPNTHYVKSVEIRKNSVSVAIKNYTSQPSADTFTYTYSVAAEDADILEATATCSIAGSNTGQVTVRAQAPPTITIEVPGPGGTVYNTQTTVSGKATGDLTNGKVELSANGGPWLEAIGTGSWGLQITLNEGQNNVTARVTDSKGNTAEAKVLIIVKSYTPIPEPPKERSNTPGFEAVTILLCAICLVLVLRTWPDRRK